MIGPTGAVRVLVATKPVDFRPTPRWLRCSSQNTPIIFRRTGSLRFTDQRGTIEIDALPADWVGRAALCCSRLMSACWRS